ncbi:hypothetical protein BSKO_12814 [Bryopsis sp. KO-2023]|nr:hypothetical protein BSKO_12814 [Bryopsis sp. KO-2023]
MQSSGRAILAGGTPSVASPKLHNERHWYSRPRSQILAGNLKGGFLVRCSAEESADWDKEMDTYRKRTMKPNQLATLRQLEEENLVTGTVLAQRGGVAVIEGLNNDAPNGTAIEFSGGATGVLLWRRSDNLCCALVLNGATVEEGENVQCKVQGIIQVVDEATGPSTKREYEVLKVPTGRSLVGKTVDYMGVPIEGPRSVCNSDKATMLPLLNEEVDMQSREVIFEPLVTGVKAIDVLTPVGRGQNMLILGTDGTGKTSTALDIILGQKHAGVQCVYAATDSNKKDLERIKSVLEKGKAMEYTTVVTGGGSTNGGVAELYAIMCSAMSIAEQVRDSGGHALVVVDSMKPMIDLWVEMNQALGASGTDMASSEKESEDNEFDLVEYEGMLISATAAERRRFFGSFMQRAAKVKRVLGGGTLSLFCILQGTPATGITSPEVTIPGYETLSEEMKAKLLQKLKKNRESGAGSGGHPEDSPPEVIEEFMSISDGQVILDPQDDSGKSDLDAPVNMRTTGSISRIGTRAYPPIMQAVASQIRFDLAQAEDARQFVANPGDPVVLKAEKRAQQVMKALSQPPQTPVAIEDQVLGLLALNSGLMESISPENVPESLQAMIEFVKTSAPELITELASVEMLTEALKAKLLKQCKSFLEK